MYNLWLVQLESLQSMKMTLHFFSFLWENAGYFYTNLSELYFLNEIQCLKRLRKLKEKFDWLIEDRRFPCRLY